MKTLSHALRATDLFAAGLLLSVAGCAGVPLRTATSEMVREPAVASGGNSSFEAPTPTRIVEPTFPMAERRAGITGTVSVNCLVDELGNVRDAAVVRGSDMAFSDATLAALKRWKFNPGLRDGVPVPVLVTVPVNYTFRD